MATLIKGKALTLRIGALAKNAKDMVAEIHYLAQCACVEAVETRNVTKINKLYEACRDVGVNPLMRWLAKHGPVSWNMTEQTFEFNEDKRKIAEEKGEAYATELSETPVLTEQKKSDVNAFIAFDLEQRIKSIIAQAEAKQADADRKGKTDKNGKADSFALLTELKTILALAPSKTAKAPVAKAKSGKVKHVKLTAATETVATA